MRNEKMLLVALAHLAGKAFRIGHMGNTTEEMLEKAILQIGETMKELGFYADIEKAVQQFKELALPVAKGRN